MILFWKIRYLDRSDKSFKNRYLLLHTQTLDPITRAAVELAAETRSSKTEREILRYRNLFENVSLRAVTESHSISDHFHSIFLTEYFEDEAGNELSQTELGRILSGDPSAIFIPPGAKQHDIELILSEPAMIPLAGVSLSDDEIEALAYFDRDLKEMLGSAFMKQGPATLKSSGGHVLSPEGITSIETPATDEEIRSFVSTFRRLFSQDKQDPGTAQKTFPIAVRALGSHPYARWIDGVAKEYSASLASVPDNPPFIPEGTCTFTTRDLIDVFLNTRFAHQPNERRKRQYADFLAQLAGKHELLAWMFLTEMWKCALVIANAGKVISQWFCAYCAHHSLVPPILKSLRDDHPGIGVLEKEEHRRDRIRNEKILQVAKDLWNQAGSPSEGYYPFLDAARDHLDRKLRDE